MARMFGTDGVRGVAGSELTIELATKLGQAGAYVLTKEQEHQATIIVGCDTRISGGMLASALMAGICSVGANAIFVGVMPTPAIAYLTRKHKVDAGVVISASHNPMEFNGIKFFNGEGYKLSDELEDEIEALIRNNMKDVNLPIGSGVGKIDYRFDLRDEYVEFMKKCVPVDLTGMKIVVDCAEGAAHYTSVKALKDLGADLVAIHTEPDGTNINANCGSTHMDELKARVVYENAAVGIAFDGDADRCIAVDENGSVVDGDLILYVYGRYLKEKGKLRNNTVVTTIMSNFGLYKAFDELGVDYEKTQVGDKYVYENMVQNGHRIGGEQSGHIIFSKYATTGDGILTAIKMMEVMLEKKQSLATLTSPVRIYPQVLKNVRVKSKPEAQNDADVQAAVKQVAETLGATGRILVRESGTEPVIRVMVEAETKEECEKYVDSVIEVIEKKGHCA